MPLDYSWVRKGNKDLPRKAYTKDYNRVLVIPDIQFGDEGTYSCLVRGRINADDKDVFLSIDGRATDSRDVS